jgi:Ca2+-binding EF-hand superfamily protein
MRFASKAPLGLGLLCCLAVTFAFAQNQAQRPAGGAGNQNQPGGQAGGQNPPRFDSDRFFKDHDRNNDGKLSKDELPAQAQQDFDKMDTNKDGSISKDELRKHAELMSHQRPQLVEVIFYAIDIPEEQVTTQELQDAYDQLRKIDKNNNGKLEDSEINALREQRQKERLDGIFQALDRNKDGKISKDEARGLWTDNFAQLDKNNDGALDKQEVEAACKLHMTGHGGEGGKPGGQQPKPGQPPKR